MRVSRRHAVLFGFCGVLGACSARVVREEDVFHEPALRASSVPAESEGERELLSRLSSLAASDEPMRFGDRVYRVIGFYMSASGRHCASLRESSSSDPRERTRVACEEHGAWAFVPDVFGGADPFAATIGRP
jgi:hypothetical protein